MRHTELVEDPPSARDTPLSVDSTSRPALIIGAHISLQQERRVLSLLQGLYVLMILLALGTGLGALYGYWRLGGKQLFAVACFSVIPLLASIVSLIGAKQSRAELGLKEQMLLRVQQVVGEDVHLLGFCHTLYAFAGFTVLGLACGLARSQIGLSLTSESETPGLWSILHPTDTLSSLTSLSQCIYGLIAGGCLLYASLALVSAGFVTWLSMDNECTHTVVQIVDSAQVFVGLFLAFAAEFTYQVSQDIIWAGLPAALLRLSLCISILSVLFSLFSFQAAKDESECSIKLSIVAKTILALVAGYFLMHSAADFSSLQSSITSQCADLMEVLDFDYLGHLGCKAKYSSFSMYENMDCPKGRIRQYWEKNVGENRLYETYYGCLDSSCCIPMSETTLEIADYIAASMATGVILLLLGAIVSCALLRKLRKRGPALFHTADTKLGIVLLLALLLGPAALYAALPLAPVPKPDLVPSLSVAKAGALPDNLNPEMTLCVRIPMLLSLSSDLLQCECEDSKLKVRVESGTGEVRVEDYAGINADIVGMREVVMSSKDVEALDTALRSVLLCGFCYNAVGNVTMSLFRVEQGSEIREIPL